MSIQVRTFQADDAGAWDEFVNQHPCGSLFHLTAWKRCIESTFGFRSTYLLAASGNSWDIAFYASAALYALGGLCWLVLDPVTPLDRPATI